MRGLWVVLVLVSCAGSPTAPEALVAAEVEAASFALVNASREAEGLERVALDLELARIARAHAEAMRNGRWLGHVGPDGVTLRGRLSGVEYLRAAENVARVAGSPDPALAAHRGFLGNAVHRANLLGPYGWLGTGAATLGNEVWLVQVYVGR